MNIDRRIQVMFTCAALGCVIGSDAEQVLLCNFFSFLIIFGCCGIGLDWHAKLLLLFLNFDVLGLALNDKLRFLSDLVESRRLLISILN